MKVLFVLLAFNSLEGFKNRTDVDYVINVKEAPWTVCLRRRAYRIKNMQFAYLHYCTGIIISDHYILTAGTCLDTRRDWLQGNVDTDNPADTTLFGYTMTVRKTIRHPNYRRILDNIENNIGLMKVRGAFEYTAKSQMAQIGELKSEWVVVLAWGPRSPKVPNSYETVLRAMEMQVIPAKECQEAYEKFERVIDDETQFCAFAEDSEAMCEGGTGGGALDLESKEVVGISYGAFDCSVVLPLVFTKTIHYVEWIRNATHWEVK